MKPKKLKKKIQELENRLREDSARLGSHEANCSRRKRQKR